MPRMYDTSTRVHEYAYTNAGLYGGSAVRTRIRGLTVFIILVTKDALSLWLALVYSYLRVPVGRGPWGILHSITDYDSYNSVVLV